MTRKPVSHDPMRPLWRCRACGADWPCQPARLALLVEYRGRTSALLTHLGNQLKAASDQLRQLNGRAPDGLAERFLAWTVVRDQQAPEPLAVAFDSADMDLVLYAVELIIRSHLGSTCPKCADDGSCAHVDWANEQLARLSGRSTNELARPASP
ncbi:flavin reductase [Salinispora arenicola]|uniref:flavin reductase n=1 Tax=Salinispora arenicola TaxID=168697 RepID=UPI0009B74245